MVAVIVVRVRSSCTYGRYNAPTRNESDLRVCCTVPRGISMIRVARCFWPQSEGRRCFFHDPVPRKVSFPRALGAAPAFRDAALVPSHIFRPPPLSTTTPPRYVYAWRGSRTATNRRCRSATAKTAAAFQVWTDPAVSRV